MTDSNPGAVIPDRQRSAIATGLQLRHLWLGMPVFLLLCKASIFPLPLLDFWWHLKMGEVILTAQTIPQADIFSFTAAGRPFVVHNWLAEVIYFLTYRAGGFPLLIALNVLLLVAALLPVYALCRATAPRLGIAAFAATVAVFAMPCNPRPQVFSFVLFSLFLSILWDHRDAKRNRLWILPLLMILWANLHGAFVIGLGLVALFLISGEVGRFLSAAHHPPASSSRNLALVLLFCTAATLANPVGAGVFSYIHTVVNDPSSRQFVVEWQPPSITSLQGILQFYLPFFLSVIVITYARRKPDWIDLSLFGCFAAFGLAATRNAVWFVLLNSVIMAKYLPSFDLETLVSRFRPATSGWPSPARAAGCRAGNWFVMGMSFLVVAFFSPWVQPRLTHSSLLDASTPVRAMDYIEAAGLQGHIFHPQAYGDYLIWRLWPHQRSFFDGRVHLFGEEFVRRYQQVFSDSHWEELLEPLDIRYLLLDKADKSLKSGRLIDRARRSGRWNVLYEDGLSILLENRRAAAPVP